MSVIGAGSACRQVCNLLVYTSPTRVVDYLACMLLLNAQRALLGTIRQLGQTFRANIVLKLERPNTAVGKPGEILVPVYVWFITHAL